jgi:CRP-like cAMP-binding protein
MKTHRIALIRTIPLLATLRGTETEFLAGVLREVEIPAGTLLFREGEPGARFDILVEGELRSLRRLAPSTSACWRCAAPVTSLVR